MIIIKGAEIFCDNITILIYEQRPLQVKYANVIKSVPDHEINLAFQVGSMIYFVFSFQSIDFFSDALAGRTELFIF